MSLTKNLIRKGMTSQNCPQVSENNDQINQRENTRQKSNYIQQQKPLVLSSASKLLGD